MELKKLIEVKNISFGYSQQSVLDGVSFNISAGEIVTLLGPNGCGKSTLIKLILGLLIPDEGTVCFDGKDMRQLSRKFVAGKIAYVPQMHKSSFPYSVRDVVLMGRLPHKTFFLKFSKKDRTVAQEALDMLNIGYLADRPYTEISGGEKHLALIARALAQGAKVFVMDEPASGLDYGNQMRLLEQIIKLSRKGYTFIKSTHSPEHALWIADRAIMLKDGRIMADGKCDHIICHDNMLSLYNARINVLSISNSIKVCIPQAICGCHELSPVETVIRNNVVSLNLA